MKFSYNWLKELVNFKQTPAELADLINLHITEVEAVSPQTTEYSSIIVAEILEINSHPNADKLHLVKLDIGRGRQIIVVCGASNIEIGQKVPLALVGAKLPKEEIKSVVIRGVESNGMICSAAELGLEEKSAGIMTLPKTASVGRPVNEFLDINKDTILDLKILSNRPDYLSYIGIAREIAAVLGQKWSVPIKIDYQEDNSIIINDKVSLNIKDKIACPYYSAGWAGHVEVKESPRWLKDKLISGGLRPINNLVDISNLVMLETGQPIHIFDAQKVKDQKVIVRQAKPKEQIVTLDNQKLSLNNEVLLIADSQSSIAIAGIMGGLDSAVSDATKEIVIEAATFNLATIRRGAKSLGISTDASLRFERGLNPYLTKLALSRTLHLIQKIMPNAKIAKGIVSFGEQEKSINIDFTVTEINNLLGIKISKSKIISILESLEFSILQSGNNIKVQPPLFRLDLSEKADIAEEIIRIIGIDKIEPKMPYALMQAPQTNQTLRQVNEIKNYLVKAGFNEALSHSFIGKEWASKLGINLKPELKLINPLNNQWTHLVSSLWPNLLKFATNNQLDSIKLFEINTIFEIDNKDVLPKEKLQLTLVASAKNEDNYRLLRGIIEQLFCDLPNIKFAAVPGSSDDMYINILRIMSDQNLVGSVEELSPRLADTISVPRNTVLAYLDLDLLFQLTNKQAHKFKSFSYYPSSSFDLSIELPIASSTGNLIADIKNTSNLIVKVDVFDVYKLDDNKRSIGLRIVLQAYDKTLVDSEIKSIESKIINLIITQYRGKIRGSDKG